MEPWSRVLRLPALAVLLPCLVIGMLTFRWLALEREAAAHRSAEAAQRLVAELRRELLIELDTSADSAAHVLNDLAPKWPLFKPPGPIAPLVAAAYLIEPSGKLIAPAGEAVLVEDMDHVRPYTGTTTSRNSASLAASRLALARRLLAAQNPTAAERAASEITRCCAGARDEYGLSFAIYAAWLRIVGTESRPEGPQVAEQVGRELRQLMEEGHLGAPPDSTQLALLARRANHAPAVASLVPILQKVSAEVTRRVEMGRLAGQWIRQTDLRTATGGVLIWMLGRNTALETAAMKKTNDGRIVVIVVEPGALRRWINQWAAARDAAIEVRERPTQAPRALQIPLFADLPTSPVLVVPPQGAQPVADGTRRRLFIAAVVVVIVLTMMIGYLAARDVSREMGTIALRSTFVAAVTHELKTPLASIRMLAETLRQGRTRPESREALLDTIVEETDRLGRLIDNVLSSSRIESGTRAYIPQALALPGAVRDAIRRFDYVLKQEGFRTDLRVDDETVEVQADPDALSQAILNLLGNAVKYSGDSRVIHVGVERRGHAAIVSVADEGIGIAAALRNRVFEPFYRAPQAMAETTGAGLGLALVRHFAEAHGGRVTVESEPRRGSVFSISLPLKADVAAVESSVQPGSGEVGMIRHG